MFNYSRYCRKIGSLLVYEQSFKNVWSYTNFTQWQAHWWVMAETINYLLVWAHRTKMTCSPAQEQSCSSFSVSVWAHGNVSSILHHIHTFTVRPPNCRVKGRSSQPHTIRKPTIRSTYYISELYGPILGPTISETNDSGTLRFEVLLYFQF